MRRAFTLVELLVVLAVASLLIALLLPALGSARDTSRSLQCLSIARQHAVGTLTMANDNEGGLIQYRIDRIFMVDVQESFGGLTLESVLCPAVNAPDGNGAGDAQTAATWDVRPKPGGPTVRVVTSYAVNGFLFSTASESFTGQPPGWQYASTMRGGAVERSDWWGSRVDQVDRPSEVPYFADAAWPDFWAHHTDAVPLNSDGAFHAHSSAGLPRIAFERHPGPTISLSYVDGHASATDVAELWRQRWHRTYEPQDVNVNW